MNQESGIKNQKKQKKDRHVFFARFFHNSLFIIRNSSGGFTLLEMIVSFGIFTMLVVAAIGVTIGISNAQIKAANTQAIIDNIRFSLELISKEMRTGSGYTLSTTCVSAPEIGSEISFLTSSGDVRLYYLDSTTNTIMRAKETISTANCSDPAKVRAFTSEEVSVGRLNFTLEGATPGPGDGQPRITISMQVTSNSPKYQLQSTMNLQTTVVQRFRDL